MEFTFIHYHGDLPNVITRLVTQAAERLTAPGAVQRDPSPVHHGEDTRRFARRLLKEAGGDRKAALALLKSDIRHRYPGFRAVPSAPGYLEYDRLRQYLYKVKPAQVKNRARIQN